MIQKAAFPYLVDISITNYCDENCPFCYTNATTNGKHADLDFLKHLSQILFESKVFECCFGGGSVTFHPDLPQILKAFKDKWFKVAFSTKKYDFLNFPSRDLISEYCTSIAFSCNTIEDLDKLIICMDEWRKARWDSVNDITGPVPIFYIQTILGLMDFDYLLKFLEYVLNETNIGSVTLLGYKNFGRGEKITPKKIPSNWFKLVQKIPRLNIGVDSIIVEQYRDQLIEGGVLKNRLVCKEGLTTCFIDAVNMEVKRSSFCEEGVSINKDITSKEFLEIFASFK